ncbi:MAG: DUF481 domain-containing protein [Gemmatimonadales bacterium]|nr:DUF481 domain-containing protein [Gemmatimonadales bacterium]
MVEKGNSRNLIPTVFLSLFLLMAASPTEAAIVNSLTGFAEKDPGWSGNLGGSFAAKGGNTEQSTFAANTRLQWQGERETWRLIGSAKRTSSGGQETARALLGHLRHNHSLSEKWSTLAFLQAQENPFQRLASRVLAGVGLRWDVFADEHSRLALGAAHMMDREEIEDETGVETSQRLSLFLTTGVLIREGIVFNALAFFQPAWSDPDDYRLMLNVGLDVEVAANVSLFTDLELEGDSCPPTEVDKYDWENRTGLRFKF